MQDMQETGVQSPGGEDPLEKERATHSSVVAWRVPWTEEAGRSQSRTWLSMHTQHCKAAIIIYNYIIKLYFSKFFKNSAASLDIKNKGKVFFNQMKKGGPSSIILNHETSAPGYHGPCTGLFSFC